MLKYICTSLEDIVKPYTDFDIMVQDVKKHDCYYLWLEAILGSGYRRQSDAVVVYIRCYGERREDGEAEEVNGYSKVVESHRSSHLQKQFFKAPQLRQWLGCLW